MRFAFFILALLASIPPAMSEDGTSKTPPPQTYDMTAVLLQMDGKQPLLDTVPTPENPDCKKPDDFACRKFAPLTLGDICVRALYANLPSDTTPGQAGQVATLSASQSVQQTVRHNLGARIFGDKSAHLSGAERDAIIKRIKSVQPQLGLSALRAITILDPDDADLSKPIEQ